ncbi:hypothetical protein FB567DRAFT_261116 [Paraphoma chrysanthemicola]|uniref:Nucleotide-diphospho-sugar transferase domain-containing protein n=1 Tax=Paraphoma chrysanthemicola TaxID=798071 RepID=A0A8K0QT57_9PLEO|nr:hypothetical protein FB567DRAFT_261116 [Paraphoma chrysanthemicola]
MLAAQRYYVFALAIFASLLSITFFFFRHDEPVVNERIAKSPYRSSKPSLRDTITTLFDSIKHDPSVPSYRDPTGRFFVANQTIWPKPLGKKILIVDIDTRVPTGENQILNPDTLDFENLDMHGGGLVSNAIINHYMYSIIHGYDYKFYQAQHIPDHHDTWIMPHVFRELIDDYDFVIAMDADVTIAHLDLPLEWMFNKWGIEKHTSMALPWDTEEKHGNLSISVDSKGLRVLNTGFVVAQNSNTTRDLLEKWRDCTSEERYPGCAQWKEKWSHEQRAFSEYIRYDYNNTPETIVSIPCDDAVGWPGFKKDAAGYNDALSDCNGNFVRHYTLGKDQAKTASSFGVMQLLGQVLQRNLLREQERVWVKEAEKSREGEVEGEVAGPKGMQSEVKKQEKGEEKATGKDDAVPAILEGMVPATSG